MKNLIITAFLFIWANSVFGQVKNEYTVGYGKYFPDIFYKGEHYLFWQYSHLTNVDRLSWSVQGGFYTQIYLYNPPFPDRMNIIVSPGVDFPFEGIIKHDPVTTGIKQFEFIDGKFTSFRLSFLAKYKFRYLKFLFTSVYSGVGLSYFYDHGLYDGFSFDFNDPKYPQGEGELFFPNYINGINFHFSNVLQTGIIVNDKLDIGIDLTMDIDFGGGVSLFSNSLFINFKF